MAITLTINGKKQSVDAAPGTPLLWVLRDHLDLPGAKFGCGIGQCGACTVLIDGAAMRSCSVAVSGVAARRATPGDRLRGNTLTAGIQPPIASPDYPA